MSAYPFFEIEKRPDQKTAILYFNRPEKLNAMNWPFWRDLPLVVGDLEADPSVRVVIIAGRGKSFTVGLDVFDFFTQFQSIITGASASSREELRRLILKMQEGFDRIAGGEKVYICACHRHCIGAGLDIASACDLRISTRDTVFSLRETKIAIVADMGSLNRLPAIIGQGNARLMALTGRDVPAEEALRMGLLNAVYETQEAMTAGALALAAEIAANAAPAVAGAKHILNYMQDHSVRDGLNYVAAWNSAFLSVEEIQKALTAMLEKKKP
jgi:enoyl-CoA hydratase